MQILRGYQKQMRAGDGKLKSQFPRSNIQSNSAILYNLIIWIYNNNCRSFNGLT